MILMMSRGYCDEYGYEIQPLDNLVPIEGSRGADVPYLGYVEVRIHIPGIHSFDRNVLMLVSHITTCIKVILRNRTYNFLVETSFCQFSNMASSGLKKMFILQFYIHKKCIYLYTKSVYTCIHFLCI